MPQVQLLSGGAAQALVQGLAPRLAEEGITTGGSFGAVGAQRDKLLAGEPCDLLILTQALVRELEEQGHVRAGSARDLGRVRTGIAVKAGEPLPRVDDEASLKATLEKASAIYFPDPVKATAGIHFMKVMKTLGLDEKLKDRFRTFPNGNTAMNAMAQSGERGSVGCTQVTEILFTAGVQLVANLPKAFELATVYTAGVATKAREPEAAAAMAELMASDAAAELRRTGGFDPL